MLRIDAPVCFFRSHLIWQPVPTFISFVRFCFISISETVPSLSCAFFLLPGVHWHAKRFSFLFRSGIEVFCQYLASYSLCHFLEIPKPTFSFMLVNQCQYLSLSLSDVSSFQRSWHMQINSRRYESRFFPFWWHNPTTSDNMMRLVWFVEAI